MQEGDIIRAGHGHPVLRFVRLLRLIHREPLHLRCTESLDYVRPGAAHPRICHNEARGAAGDNARTRIERAVPPRQHHRHRYHACQNTAEIRDNEIESRPEQQQRPITGSAALTQACSHRGCAPLQLTEGQDRFLIPLVRQEHVGALVGLLGCTAGEQIDKRGKGQASLIEHADRSANRSVLGSATRGQIAGQCRQCLMLEYEPCYAPVADLGLGRSRFHDECHVRIERLPPEICVASIGSNEFCNHICRARLR